MSIELKFSYDRRERLLNLGGAEANNVEAQSTRDEESDGTVEPGVVVPRPEVELSSSTGVAPTQAAKAVEKKTASRVMLIEPSEALCSPLQ